MNAARSFALRNADLVLLVGARLNWMLHYGRPPRFSPTCKYVARAKHSRLCVSLLDTRFRVKIKDQHTKWYIPHEQKNAESLQDHPG